MGDEVTGYTRLMAWRRLRTLVTCAARTQSCRYPLLIMGESKSKSALVLLSKKKDAVLTAMAMAIEDSVTVSIGEEMRGVLSVIFLVRADVKSYETA